MRESKTPCRVNGTWDGLFHLFEQPLLPVEGNPAASVLPLVLWGGTIDLTCIYGEGEKLLLETELDLQIELEDGRRGEARRLYGTAQENLVSLGGDMVGSTVLLYVVGLTSLARPMPIPDDSPS